MIENQSAHQSIPLLKSNEEQLAKIRRQLEGMYIELRLVQDVIVVACETCKSESTYVEDSLEHVLRRCGSNNLFRVMKTLTRIIERFGGTTEMSEACEKETQATQPITEDQSDGQSEIAALPRKKPLWDIPEPVRTAIESQRLLLYRADSMLVCFRHAWDNCDDPMEFDPTAITRAVGELIEKANSDLDIVALSRATDPDEDSGGAEGDKA